MRYLIYFSLFLLQLAFISCEKEEIIEDTPKETPYYLGYFEGAVNGQDISIRNKSASWRYIDAGFYSEVRRGEWEVLRCSHWTIPLDHIFSVAFPPGPRTKKPLCDEGGIAPITRRRI